MFMSASKASSSFLKKRTKKLLSLGYPSGERSATAETKVFCFFSSEKKALLSVPGSHAPVPRAWSTLAACALLLGALVRPGFAQQSPSLTPQGPTSPPSVSAAVPPLPASALTKQDVEAWLDGYMPYALARGDVAGAVVVVVKDGQVLTEKGYGYADVAAHTPVDPETTLFRPGSVSKLFTWTAVMQMLEAGRVSLDQDVNSYIDFKIPPYQGQPVTLRNLMTHTPGFEETNKDLIFEEPTPEPKLDAYLKTHLPARIFPPGQIPAYSNYGATLAGYIVQRLSGEAFDDYVEHHIFSSLGMQHATFRQPLPAALKASMSKGYEKADGPAKTQEVVGPAPAGSSAISGGDMAHFMIAHLQDGAYNGQRILQASTAQMMHSTALNNLPPLNSMLLGFYQMNRNGHRIIGHGGDTQWFHSELSLFLDDHVGLFVSMNSIGVDGAVGPIRQALRESFADRYFPGPAPQGQGPGPQGQLDAAGARANNAKLAGTYITSRREDSSVFSLLYYLLETSPVSVGDNGQLTVGGERGLSGQPQPFDAIGPLVWRAAGEKTRLAAKLVGGNVAFWGDDNTPFEVATPVPFAKDAVWLKPALIASVVALLLTALFWPVTALYRRRYGAELTLRGAQAASYRLTRVAALLDAVLMIAWPIVVFVMLQTFALNGTFDPLLTVLHWATIVVFPLALLIFLWNATVVWTTRPGVRGLFARLWSVVLVASGLVLVWTGAMFHLIGTSLTY